jgi:hypothetical protein
MLRRPARLGRKAAHGGFAVVLSVSKAFMIISHVHHLRATGQASQTVVAQGMQPAVSNLTRAP